MKKQVIIPIVVTVGFLITLGLAGYYKEKNSGEHHKKCKHEKKDRSFSINYNTDFFDDEEIILDDYTKEEKKLQKGDAEKLRTKIRFVSGKLNLDGNTEDLLESQFRFIKERWNPVISYEEEENKGYLKIISKDDRENKNYNNDDNSIWDVSLNKDIEQKLDIKIGAGIGNINLEDFDLKELEFHMAAGEMNLNLRNTSISDLEFGALAGEATIDLSGEYQNDLHAEINGGVGNLVVYVPENIGVKLEIRGLLGDIDTPGFKKRKRIYTNEAYNETEHNLYIQIRGGIGDVTVKMKQ